MKARLQPLILGDQSNLKMSMNPFNIIGSSIPRAVGRFFGSSQPGEGKKDRTVSSSILSSSPPSKIPRATKSPKNTNGIQGRSPGRALGSSQGMGSGGKGVDGEGDVNMDRLSGSEPEAYPEHLPEPESEKRRKKEKRTSKSKGELREAIPESEDILEGETADRVEPPPILPGHLSTGKKRVSQFGLDGAQDEHIHDSPITHSSQSKRSKGKKRAPKPVVNEKEIEGPLGIELIGRVEPPPTLPGQLKERSHGKKRASRPNFGGVDESMVDSPYTLVAQSGEQSKNRRSQIPDIGGEEPESIREEFDAGPDFDETPTINKSKKKSLPVVELPQEDDVSMNYAPTINKPKEAKKKSLPVAEPQSLEQGDVSMDERPASPPRVKIRAPKKSKSKVHTVSDAAPETEEVEPVVENVQATANSKKKKKAKSLNAASVQVSVEEVHESDPEATPSRPSAKALGKRKASPIAETTQKKRKRAEENKRNSGVSLFDLGFTSQRSPQGEDLVRSSNYSHHLAVANGLEEQEPSPEPEPSTSKSSRKRKSKAKAPIILGSSRPSTATSRKDTPRRTPAKKPSKPVNLDIGGSDSDDSLVILPPPSSQKKKHRLLVDEDDEPGPSSVKSKASSRVSMSQVPIKDKDEPPRKGKITAEELQAITSAVELYREMHDLSEYQMAEIVQMAELNLIDEHEGFWKEIREAVPNLPNRKVFETCRRKFHNFEARGSWNATQDEELKKAYERFPQKWKQIGGMINRFPEDARDRWRNYLVCGDKLRKDKWDKEEEDRLREVVAECVEIAKKSLKKQPRKSVPKSYEELIDWGTVSMKMDMTRSRLQCVAKWKQIKERGDSEDERLTAITRTEWREAKATHISQTMLAPEVLELLRIIRDSGAGKESSIPWLLIVEELGVAGKNRRMAFKICFRKLREKVPGGEDMRFREILDFLIDEFEAVHPHYPEAYRNNDVIQDVQKRNRPSKSPAKKEVEDSDDPSTQILQEAAVDNGEGSSKQQTPRTRPVVEIPQRFHRPNSSVEPSSQKKKSRPSVDEDVTDGEHHLPLGSQKPFRTPKPKQAKPISPPPEEESAEEPEEQHSSKSKKKRRKSKSKAKVLSPQPDGAQELFVGANSGEQEQEPLPSPKKPEKSKSKARVPSPQFDVEERVVEVEEQRQSLKSKKKDRKSKSKARVQSPQLEKEVPEPIPEVDSEEERQAPPSRKKFHKSKSKSKAKVAPLSEEQVLDSDEEEAQQAPLSPVKKSRKSKSKAKVSHLSDERVIDSDDEEEQQAPISSGKKSHKSKPKARNPSPQTDEVESDLLRTKENKRNQNLRDRMEPQEEVTQEPVEGFGFAADMSDDLDDVMQSFKAVKAELQKRKERQKSAQKVMEKEMPVNQHLQPDNEEEEIIDASQFSEHGDEPQTNGHVEEDLEMLQVDENDHVSEVSYNEEPLFDGYASDSSSDRGVEVESQFNGFASEEDSDVPNLGEEEVAPESLDQEYPLVNDDESQWYKDLLAEEAKNAALQSEEPLVKSEDDFEMAEVRSPVSVHAVEPLVNGYHSQGDGEQDNPEVSDAEENLQTNEMVNGNTVDDDSEIDDDSNNFGYRGDFSDSDSSDLDIGQHDQDLDADAEHQPGPEEMDIDQEEPRAPATPSKSPSPVTAQLGNTEQPSDSASTSGSSSDDSSSDSDEELADEPETNNQFPHPDDEIHQPEFEDHEMAVDAMHHEEPADSDNDSEHLEVASHEVEYEQISEAVDDEMEQMADDELEQEPVVEGYEIQQNVMDEDMADDELEEEFEEATTLIEEQPNGFVEEVRGLMAEVEAIQKQHQKQPVEYQPETEVTPEPFIAQASPSPDLDTPVKANDGPPRSVSPNIGTPVKPDGGPSRSVSPDLDTPIKGDGRASPREFRTRVKQINYDDTAALRTEEEEAMLSSDEEIAQPKRGKGGRKVDVADTNNLPPNGVNHHNGFGPINGFEAIRRQHGRPETPLVRPRSDSESSSDYSIPAEATPTRTRGESL